MIEAVLASYGGVHAYNAPLYAVDRLVRLSRRDVEARYLPMCARVAGLPLDALTVDRGRRRFISSRPPAPPSPPPGAESSPRSRSPR